MIRSEMGVWLVREVGEGRVKSIGYSRNWVLERLDFKVYVVVCVGWRGEGILVLKVNKKRVNRFKK